MGADLAGETPGLPGFPGTLTSFVGRSERVREVASPLGTSRLVTVLGPGGVGKTRLALEEGLVQGHASNGKGVMPSPARR